MMIRNITELREGGDLRRWMALLVACFGQLMVVLDVTIVNVALPAMQRDLGFGAADLTWVVNAYGISYGGFVLLAGRLGDLLGRRRVFLAGVALFTVASAICGLATSPGALIAARFVQGLGGSLSAGVIIAMIVTGFPQPRERAQAMSLFVFTVASGGSLGLLAGGLLTQNAGWRWVFFVNLPIGLATVLAGRALLARDRGPGLSRGIDIAGSVLVTGAVMTGVYAIVTAAASGWTSVHTLGFGGLALALLTAFLWLEGRLRDPIMPLRVFRIRTLAGAAAIRGLLATGMFATFFVGALYLEHLRGYSALSIGLAFLPYTAGNALTAIALTARLVGRFGSLRVLITGLLLVGGALLLNAGFGPGTAYFPGLFAAYALFGIGVGLSLTPLTLIGMSEVPAADAGLGSGVGNASMQVSASLGLAALGTVASDHARELIAGGMPVSAALAGGYQLVFLITAALVAAALLVAGLVLREPAPASAAEELELEMGEAA